MLVTQEIRNLKFKLQYPTHKKVDSTNAEICAELEKWLKKMHPRYKNIKQDIIDLLATFSEMAKNDQQKIDAENERRKNTQRQLTANYIALLNAKQRRVNWLFSNAFDEHVCYISKLAFDAEKNGKKKLASAYRSAIQRIKNEKAAV